MGDLGSIGMDAVASGSSGSTILPISLVKSDWKLQSKNPVPGSGFPFPYPALSALRQICQN